MEEACQIFSYLPIRYKNDEEAEYVQYLWRAFENNYQNELYQFAFMSYHMLFMCFVYFTIWKIKSIHSEDYENVILGFSKIENAKVPFDYSKCNESAVFTLLRYWKISIKDIETFQKLVEDRNKIAHSNGNIFYKNRRSLDDKLSSILSICDQIQQKTKPTIEQSYKEFLFDNHSVEDSPYSTLEELLSDEFLGRHYISEKDMQLCCDCNISSLSFSENFNSIFTIHTDITNLYKDE